MTESNDLLMFPGTPARVWHLMNATDHISVVFRKSAYSLMSRVTASPNSMFTAIVNSDAYQQSARMDKWEIEYVICIKIRIGRIIFQYVKVRRMTN